MIYKSPLSFSQDVASIDIYAPGKPNFLSVATERNLVFATLSAPTTDADGGDLSGISGIVCGLFNASDKTSIDHSNFDALALAKSSTFVEDGGEVVEFQFDIDLERKYVLVAYAFEDTSVIDETPVEIPTDEEPAEPQA